MSVFRLAQPLSHTVIPGRHAGCTVFRVVNVRGSAVSGWGTGRVVNVAIIIPFGVGTTGLTGAFVVTAGSGGDVVTAVARVFVGAAVWKVYWGGVVETLTGALVATCKGAISTGRNGKRYPPAVIRYSAVSSLSTMAVHGAGIVAAVKRQNRKNRIHTLRAGTGAGRRSAVIQVTIFRAL